MGTRTPIQIRIENNVTNGRGGYEIFKIGPNLKTLQAGLTLALGLMDVRRDFNASLIDFENRLGSSCEKVEIRYSAYKGAGWL